MGVFNGLAALDRPSPAARLLAAFVGLLLATSLTGAAVTIAAQPAAANGSVTVSVRTTAGALRVRSGPSILTAEVGSVGRGARVQVACRVAGQIIQGAVSRTNQWDRLVSGNYISHAYVVGGPIPVCHTPEPHGSMSQAQFIAASVELARQGRREFGVPASVTIAQAIIESGWGRSWLSADHRNYFGIKCFGGPASIAVGCHIYRTYECDPGGRCFRTEAQFRTYGSVADSFRDHGLFLRAHDRYKPAFAHSGDANAFLWHMWKAGYATSPTYYDNVTALMRQHDLYRYDR